MRSRALKGFGVYFLSSALNKALPFLLLPVMTRYLTPYEYGTVAIYQALISFSVPFVGMSMQQNVTRNYFQVEREELARIVGNIVAILVGSATLVLLAISVYLLIRPTFFGIPGRWLYTLPLVACMNMVNQSNLVILRNQGRAAAYGAFEIGKTALNLVVSVGLVVGMGLGWQGRATGVLAASVAFGAVGLVYLVRTGCFKWEISRARTAGLLAISLPLIPHGVGAVGMALVDRFFLNQMIGKSALGVYSVGYAFGSVTLLVTDAFNKVWSPWMYKQLADMTDAKRRRIVRFTYLYKIGVIGLALGVTGMAYVVLPFMVAKPFHSATGVVFWIAMGYAMRGMYQMFFPYVLHTGKTRYFAYVTLGAGLVNAGANFVLIPINGIVGAAQATLISWGVMYLAVWWYAARLYPMPWGRPR